jgi:hypothetical protein
MDFLLKHVNGRNLLLAVLFGLVFRVAADNRDVAYRWYMQRHYPPLGRPTALGEEIARQNERREAAHIAELHRRVQVQLDQARAQGFDVSGLKRKADLALTLNAPAYRRRAVILLGEVSMAVPRRRARSTGARTASVSADVIPDAAGSSAASRRRR